VKANRGEIIYVTEGTHEDYTVHGVFVVIKAFDQAEMAQRHYAYKQACYRDGDANPLNYVTWMSAQELIVKIAAYEVHGGG